MEAGERGTPRGEKLAGGNFDGPFEAQCKQTRRRIALKYVSSTFWVSFERGGKVLSD
jgi:hypothetical protein